jgi:dihydrofolate reductase
MRKIICYIATSADGYIARPDGSIDWLEKRPRSKGDYGMSTFLRSIDAVLWGRKTYDQVKGWGHSPTAGFGKHIRHYVFSTQAGMPEVGVEWVHEGIDTFAQRLRAQKGKNIWMMGGGGLIASFLDAGAMDEFMIHVIPTFIGEGIPLIAPRHLQVPLKLKSCTKFGDGVVRLHYTVDGSGRPARRAGAKAAGKQGQRRVRNRAAPGARHR